MWVWYVGVVCGCSMWVCGCWIYDGLCIVFLPSPPFPQLFVEPEEVNLVSSGTCGAFVHSLEDEFMGGCGLDDEGVVWVWPG